VIDFLPRNFLRFMLRCLVIWPLLLYLLFLFMLVAFKESLVYPGVQMYQHLSLEDPEYREMVARQNVELWETRDGEYLGLKRRTGSSSPKVRWLVFHGNGDVGLRATGWFEVLQTLVGDSTSAAYFVMEYPGYGPQPGKPGESVIIDQALKVMREIPKDGVPLYILGQSMGAGVTCRLMSEPGMAERVDGLLLLNPYTSLTSAGRQYLRTLVGPLVALFPVERILGDRYDSFKNITHYPGRVVVIAGGDDTLTPPWMAEKLTGQIPGPHRLWIQPGVGHWISPEPEEKWKDLIQFLMTPDEIIETTQK